MNDGLHRTNPEQTRKGKKFHISRKRERESVRRLKIAHEKEFNSKEGGRKDEEKERGNTKGRKQATPKIERTSCASTLPFSEFHEFEL